MTKSPASLGNLPGLSDLHSIQEGSCWSAKDSAGRKVQVVRSPLSGATALRLRALLERPAIHHPNLATLWGAWVRDRQGQLHELPLGREVAVHAGAKDSGSAATLDAKQPSLESATEWIVATVAPERTILDRAQECGQQGYTGIPTDELLGYLTDLGSAIDFIHRIEPMSPRAHGIVAPHNVWLSGRTARLAGWERMFVEDVRAEARTSDFAAPETKTDENLTPEADQFSLALVYHFLRTGKMPGERSAPLPQAEQAVIDRALSLDPSARYTSSLDMVKALRGACGGETVRGTSIKTMMVGHEASKSDAPSAANVPAPKLRAPKTISMVNEDLLADVRQSCSVLLKTTTPAAETPAPVPSQSAAPAAAPTPATPSQPAARSRAEQTVMMNSGSPMDDSKKPDAAKPAAAKPDAAKPTELKSSDKPSSDTPARKTPETVVMDNFFVAGPAAGFLSLPPNPGDEDESRAWGAQTVVMKPSGSTPPNTPAAPPAANRGAAMTVMVSEMQGANPAARAADPKTPARAPASQTVRIDSENKPADEAPVQIGEVDSSMRTVRDIGPMTIRQDVSPTASTISDATQRLAGESRPAEAPVADGSNSLGEYVLLNKIGGGSMGMVYKGMHRYMQRMVAIKVLSESLSADEDAVQRFVREAETAARLSHPNIVTAYNAGRDGKQHFLVMEFVEGIDLFRTVDRHGPLALRTALDYITQAARGLDYAHKAGIVHRDIKPGNLMLDREGTVKILDMGLARFFEGSGDDAGLVTRTGTIMGTLDYMPPEQAKNSKRADQRSDIYSLGCTFYYLLTGQAPYPARSLVDSVVAHRDQPIPKLVEKVRPAEAELVTAKLQSAFERMLAKQPDDRYTSTKAAIADLEAALAALPPAAPIDPLSSTVITAKEGESKGPPTVLAVSSEAPTIRSQAPQVSTEAPTVRSGAPKTVSPASAPTVVAQPSWIKKTLAPGESPDGPQPAQGGSVLETGLTKHAWQIIALVASAAAILQLVLRFMGK